MASNVMNCRKYRITFASKTKKQQQSISLSLGAEYYCNYNKAISEKQTITLCKIFFSLNWIICPDFET